MPADDSHQAVNDDLNARVRALLAEHARLPAPVQSLDDRADLFRAGMSSHASVNVMLVLESEFDIEFPDEMLTRSTFETIGAITGAVTRLRAQQLV